MQNNIFFIGAGGIGMAALERYFLSKGYKIAGYDLTPSSLTENLIKEGVDINFEGTVDSIPDEFRDPDRTLVVYTPAVPETLPCFKWFKEHGFEIIKRARLLGLVTNQSKSICVAGTHGKTTTSSIAAHILATPPSIGSNAFLGGVLRNYGTNFLLSDTSDISIIEADEFDRSFHHLSPFIEVITAVDPDHLDIYKTVEDYKESFSHFTSLIKPGGALLMHHGISFIPKTGKEIPIYTYSGLLKDSKNKDISFLAVNIRRVNNHIIFDLQLPDKTIIEDLDFGSPVEINLDNCVGAIGALWLAGVLNIAALRKALESFKGVERRFEVRWEEKSPGQRIIIDDYAHHPAEIRASIQSIREMFPNRKITVAFQPHLYSRTRDFASQFADALNLADEIILVDLYPAREKPIPGISSATIFDLITNDKKHLVKKENFSELVKNINFDVLVTLGAGDLPNYIPGVIEVLETSD